MCENIWIDGVSYEVDLTFDKRIINSYTLDNSIGKTCQGTLGIKGVKNISLINMTEERVNYEFSLYFSATTPSTTKNTATFAMLFTQDQPYSWVDIVIRASQGKKQVTGRDLLKELITLPEYFQLAVNISYKIKEIPLFSYDLLGIQAIEDTKNAHVNFKH